MNLIGSSFLNDWRLLFLRVRFHFFFWHNVLVEIERGFKHLTGVIVRVVQEVLQGFCAFLV